MDAYEVIKVVGKGTFGRAILVKLKTTKKKYIIKQVKLHNLPEKEKKEARNEVKVLSSLKHVNIVRYIKSFMDKGSLCIVMDFAEKGDLYAKIKKQRGKLFSEATIMKYFVQICSALEYVHKRHILHRDLKTQNIFIGAGDRVLLGDFGIARVLQSTMECARTMVGTPYYLSPELCREQPYNHKSDVWALGCVLYELCTLRHAFEANSMKGLIGKILRGIYPAISSRYSPDLRRLIDSMLKRDPRRRPSVEELLKHPLVAKYKLKIDAQLAPLSEEEAHKPQKHAEPKKGPLLGAPINGKALEALAEKERQRKREARARDYLEQKRKQRDIERARQQREQREQQQLIERARAIREAEAHRARKEAEAKKKQIARREAELKRQARKEAEERRRRKAEKEAYRRRKEAEANKRREAEYNRRMAQLAAEQRAKQEMQRKIRAERQRENAKRAELGARRRREAEERAEEERRRIYADNRRIAAANRARLKQAMEGVSQAPPPVVQQAWGENRPAEESAVQQQPQQQQKKKPVDESQYVNYARNQFWEGKLQAAKNRYRNYLDLDQHDKAKRERQRIIDIETQLKKYNKDYTSIFDEQKPNDAPPHGVEEQASPSVEEQHCLDAQKQLQEEQQLQREKQIQREKQQREEQQQREELAKQKAAEAAAQKLREEKEAEERSYYRAQIEEQKRQLAAEEAKRRELEQQLVALQEAQAVDEAHVDEMNDKEEDAQEYEAHHDDDSSAGNKFRLGNQTLKLDHVSETDTLCYRIESLRMYLEKQLGDDHFIAAYGILNEQDAESDDAVIEASLQKILGEENMGFTSLIHQLIFCEDMFNEGQ